MQLHSGTLALSASDLANHLACAHLTNLDREVAEGKRARPYRNDPALERLKERGKEHERAYVRHLQARGLRIVSLDRVSPAEAVQRTIDAVRGGADAIVQAALGDGRWLGYADVLVRTDEPTRTLPWSYEVQDTKLAQETRGGTVLQLCLYADLLTPLQGAPARTLRVVKPGDGFPDEIFRFADFEAYYRCVKARLAGSVDGPASATYPEPVGHCEICRWWKHCDEQRHADDHLSLVAGMRRLHAQELVRQGRATLTAFARVSSALDAEPKRGQRAAFDGLQAQARVQLRGRELDRPVQELLPHEPGRGLARLPAPSAGDVFLDFEGDPFVPGTSADDSGLEYLLGYACAVGAELCYEALWAVDRAQEKRAFERFVDLVLARLALHPGLHVYHYAPYEPAALKRLASRHATRERELDVLLRGERFVDLYAVVRQGVRASVESYSLKPLEAHFGYARKIDLRDEARPALERVAAALETGVADAIDPADRAAVQGYNEDDCRSLVVLREWLEERRRELVAKGAPDVRPPLKDGGASEEQEERGDELRALFERLVAGIPAEPDPRDDEQDARWLLAHMLEYFHREKRVSWWEYFARREMDDEELRKDRKALVGLDFVAELPRPDGERTPIHRYRFEPQEVSFDDGDDLCDLDTDTGTDRKADRVGKVLALDPAARLVDVKKTGKWRERHPLRLHVLEDVPTAPLDGALHALASWVAEHGLDSPQPAYRAARDLLLALAPRTSQSKIGALQAEHETPLEAALRVAGTLDGGVLAIQGPPGSGKTHNGARLILSLARQGKRIGVSATSHKVVRNLLQAVLKAAEEKGYALTVTHRPSDRAPRPTGLPRGYELADDKDEALAALDRGHVVGGVAWLWAAEEAEGKLDYLVIDEAGQMALAPVLACARAARNLVLLGDPQQLQQPQRGAHPEGSEVSALEHLLGGAQTIARERGLFLGETWRLAPSLCDFTSRLFYEGRLHSRKGCERQALVGATPFAGSGLFLVEAAHIGNASSAPEEVAAVERVVAALVRPGVSWLDAEGAKRALTRDDVLVIAPYNAQVAALSQAATLTGLSIGTVDLFQGQERAVVVYSLTSSTPADAPRGLPFLYDLHRLNVATSRARCACIVVASPALFEPDCRTPEQMRLANGLCALAERAQRVRL